MLAHGLMDNNVPPYNTMLVVDALTKANKDYDLVVFPNAGHGFGADSPYMMRKKMGLFCKEPDGAEPPKEFKFETKTDPRSVDSILVLMKIFFKKPNLKQVGLFIL
jgi:hypothetical protein